MATEQTNCFTDQSKQTLSRMSSLGSTKWPLMMGRHILLGILLVVLLVVATSCRSLDEDYQHLGEFKRSAALYKHVVLVCIYESHFHRMPRGYHRLDQKGIVVHSYKGDWQVGEEIAIHRMLETAPPDEWTPRVGYLQFLHLGEHTSDSIFVDMEWDYSPEFEQAMEF